MTDIDPRAFDAFEAAGWELVADRYYELLSPITGLAIEPLGRRIGIAQWDHEFLHELRKG